MTNKIKPLYQFKIPFVTEVEEVEVSKDEKGGEVKTTRKVKKEIARNLCLKRATRAEQDDSMLYYSVQVSEGMKAGMIPRALLGKMYNNDGGILSQGEIDLENELWLEFYRKNKEYQEALAKIDKTPEDQAALELLIGDMMSIRRRIQDFEIARSGVYDITAEARARTRTIIWWLLNLTYLDADYEKNATLDNPVFNWQPMFPGDTFAQKMIVRDELEEGDDLSQEEKDFYFKAIQRAAAAAAYWHHGKAATQSDFEVLEREFDQNLANEEQAAKEQKDLESKTSLPIEEPAVLSESEESHPKKRGPKPKNA